MSILRAATKSALCLALMGAVLLPGARADELNRKTVMTFSGPVEIPGIHLKGRGVLPAGTYVFKILDSQTDRHIVQIFNADETQVYATILAIPNYRLKPTDKTVVTFRERPADSSARSRTYSRHSASGPNRQCRDLRASGHLLSSAERLEDQGRDSTLDFKWGFQIYR